MQPTLAHQEMSRQSGGASDISKLRKEALEEKKKKLEKLRAAKADKEIAVASRKPDATSGPAVQDTYEDIDHVMRDILGEISVSVANQMAAEKSATPSAKPGRSHADKMASLASQHNVVSINIPAKEVPTYERGVQTTLTGNTVVSGTPGAAGPTAAAPTVELMKEPLPLTTPRGKGGLKSALKIHLPSAEAPDDAPNENVLAAAPILPGRFNVPSLSDDQRMNILSSHELGIFVSEAAVVIRRALTLDKRTGGYDVTVDYTADDSRDMTSGPVVQELCHFYVGDLCKDRAVMDIAWSIKHPELLVVCYSKPLTGSTKEDTDGTVLVWNAATQTQIPEMTFHSPSQCLRAFFSHYPPFYLVASTSDGQIVAWDKTQLPSSLVLAHPTTRTPRSPLSHTFPIYCMDLVGTDNANALVTISTDGKLRSWNLGRLESPEEGGLDLVYPTGSKGSGVVGGEPMAVTCCSFIDGDANTCIVGGEDGGLYAIARMGGEEPIETKYIGHEGPVTAVSWHPSNLPEMSTTFLSSSMDWTIRLWDRKRSVALHTFEDSGDYVFDVKWSPSHPGVFASVDGTGQLSIWNLMDDVDRPKYKVVVGNDRDRRALNRVQFSRDGKRVTVGTSHGYCYVYELLKELVTPPEKESEKHDKFLSFIVQAKSEADNVTNSSK